MKPFKNIVLVYKEGAEEFSKGLVKKIEEYIKDSSVSTMYNGDLKKYSFDKADLVIALGGDGTFIRASHILQNTPILGINPEPNFSEGALTSLNGSELDKFKQIILGRYNLIERERISVFKNGKEIEEKALNEIYVGTKDQFHTSRYKIKFKDFEEEHRSSGVLIASGSGSNAWYKSAGGKPFDFNEKRLKFIVREPFISRLFQPKILNGEINRGGSIHFESRRDKGGIIALDSTIVYDFNKGDIIKIKISNYPLRVVIK